MGLHRGVITWMCGLLGSKLWRLIHTFSFSQLLIACAHAIVIPASGRLPMLIFPQIPFHLSFGLPKSYQSFKDCSSLILSILNLSLNSLVLKKSSLYLKYNSIYGLAVGLERRRLSWRYLGGRINRASHPFECCGLVTGISQRCCRFEAR